MKKSILKHEIAKAISAQLMLMKSLAGSDNPQTIKERLTSEGKITILEAVLSAIEGDMVLLRLNQ